MMEKRRRCMNSKRLVLLSFAFKFCIVLFIGSLVWGHYIISQKWFNPLTSNAEIKRALKQSPGKVDVRNSDGLTGLMLAAAKPDPKLVKLFLEYDADPNAVSEDAMKMTPLHMLMRAINMQKDNGIAALKTLLDGGANPNIGDVNGDTAVHYTITIDDVPTRLEVLLIMVNHNNNAANINAQNSAKGDTFLHVAVRQYADFWIGNVLGDDKLRSLIDPEIKNKDNLTVPGLANQLRMGDILRTLCNKGKGVWPCKSNWQQGIPD